MIDEDKPFGPGLVARGRGRANGWGPASREAGQPLRGECTPSVSFADISPTGGDKFQPAAPPMGLSGV